MRRYLTKPADVMRRDEAARRNKPFDETKPSVGMPRKAQGYARQSDKTVTQHITEVRAWY